MNELGLLDRIDEVNKMVEQQKMGLRQAATLWRSDDALQILREFSVLCGYFVPGFHQFCFLFGV